MIALILALATASPEADPFLQQAARCGFKADQFVRTVDSSGEAVYQISPSGSPAAMPFSAIECLMRFVATKHYKFGFISEPPTSSSR